MRVERTQSFITAEECTVLNSWVDEGVSKKWLDKGMDNFKLGYANRVTSRLYANRFVYPDIVRHISNKVRSYCGLDKYPLITGHGRDGVVVSCTFTGGNVYAHRDPPSSEGLATLRCNILTRAAETGGVLHLEGAEFPLEVGELHCYLVSEHEHYVSEVAGITSRVLWMFGAHVPKEDWNAGVIHFGGIK